jgi:hypothetical protein
VFSGALPTRQITQTSPDHPPESPPVTAHYFK